MRLIDADKLKTDLEKAISKNEDMDCLDFLRAASVIDALPTAYDVDKVVQQLDDRSTLSRPVGWSKFYQIILLKDAIKIVKDGGIC